MLTLIAINPMAVITAAVLSMALGALWYSPLLLGNAWTQALGKSPAELGSPLPMLVGSAVSCFIAAFSIAILCSSLSVTTALVGAQVGLLCGLGIVAMTMLSDSLFSGWGWRLYSIQMGYRALYLLLMGALIGAWPAA